MAKTLRAWQRQALTEATALFRNNETDMSVEAGVGSGKTYFACTAAGIGTAMERGDFIIVVTINRRCQRQWVRTAKECGIPLRRVSGNAGLAKGLPSDVKGYVCTYASMGTFPDLHASFCGGHRTIVIFDEVHHINEDGQTSWGPAAITAFGSAAFRLSLSGTYFSSNGARIPFARMKPMAGSNAQFEYDPHVRYSYGDSVADQHCRRIVFKPFDGPIEYKREGERNFKVATFADDIDQSDFGNRLWAACQVKGIDGQPNQMLNEMLWQANRRLDDLRAAGHTKAGGLIICNDTGHARQVRTAIEKISGKKAVLVLNDEEGSDEALDAYANGSSAWLVAVKMVTEGVDIPRLRIGIYLSNTTKPLSFIQFLGRMVRHNKGDASTNPPVPGDPRGEAYCYYPADERLVEIANQVEEEMRVAIDLRQKQTQPGGGADEEADRERRAYQAGAVDGGEQDNVIAGDLYNTDEIEIADQLRTKWPHLAEEHLVDMVKFVREARAAQKAPPPPPPPPPGDEEDHDSLRKDCQALARKLALQSGKDFNVVHTEANRATGIIKAETATIEQLKDKRAWLEEQLTMVFDPIDLSNKLHEAFGDDAA